MQKNRLTATISLLFAFVGSSLPSGTSAQSCVELGDDLQAHACFHGRFGPFVSVTATQSGPAPTVNAVHTRYDVQLSGSGGVLYQPARSGEWAAFLSADVPFRVLAPAGNALPVALRDASTGCPELAVAQVYTLSQGVTYRLEFGPAATGTVGLVLEKLSDFEACTPTPVPATNAGALGLLGLLLAKAAWQFTSRERRQP